jgi:hypothetical protein
MEPWRAVDARNGGLDGAMRGCRQGAASSHHFNEEQDPDPNQSDADPQQDPGRIKVLRIHKTETQNLPFLVEDRSANILALPLRVTY